jgi:hypothetical protein
MAPQTSIFISHAWGGLSDEILAQLVKRLEAEDIRFVLDKRDLSYRQSIRDFMMQLGEADMVIIILSNKYLKSEYCMFELLEIHKNENLNERIFPIVLDEVRISSSADRLEFVKYWETQLLDLQNKVRELNSLSYIEGITDDLNLYSEIRNNIARLTGILRDINTLNIKLHQEADYNDLVQAIKKRIKGQRDEERKKPVALAVNSPSILSSVTLKGVIVVLFALFGLFMAWGILTKSTLFAGDDNSKDNSTINTDTLTQEKSFATTQHNENSLTVPPQVSLDETNVQNSKPAPIDVEGASAKPSSSKPKPSATKSLPVPEKKDDVNKITSPTAESSTPKIETPPAQTKPTHSATIPKGTELLARSNSNFSSDDGFVLPKKITFSLDKPLIISGNVVVPAGSMIIAKITNVKASNHNRAGVLDFVFESLHAPNGQKIPLQTNEFHLVAKGDNPMEITTQTIYKIKTSSPLQINY